MSLDWYFKRGRVKFRVHFSVEPSTWASSILSLGSWQAWRERDWPLKLMKAVAAELRKSGERSKKSLGAHDVDGELLMIRAAAAA